MTLHNRPSNHHMPASQPEDAWEAFVRQSAATLPYPPTPDVSEKVVARLADRRAAPQHPILRLQPLWVAAVLLALLLGLWAVPPVRAAILDFLQIGAVRIWLAEPTPESDSTAVSSSTTMPNSLLELFGRTTLADAEAQAGFAIRLPTYPAGLGEPDAVFYQELAGPVVVLVWMDDKQPEVPEYSLHILGNNASADKSNPPVVERTTVNGNEALWTNGPYLLRYGDSSEWEFRYLISGRVLIWQEDGLTYRLESNLSLDEAVRMAESLE
jgi:hypothetical protein